MAEPVPVFKVPYEGEGVLVPGPEAVAWIHDTDEGMDFKFFALPGPQTLREVDEWDMAYNDTPKERKIRSKFTVVDEGGVFWGYGEKSFRSHSKFVSEGIGRKVRLELSGKTYKGSPFSQEKLREMRGD